LDTEEIKEDMMEKLYIYIYYSSTNSIGVIKPRMMRWVSKQTIADDESIL
jgi:hypothetical protein